jgi:hypothetical protein
MEKKKKTINKRIKEIKRMKVKLKKKNNINFD